MTTDLGLKRLYTGLRTTPTQAHTVFYLTWPFTTRIWLSFHMTVTRQCWRLNLKIELSSAARTRSCGAEFITQPSCVFYFHLTGICQEEFICIVGDGVPVLKKHFGGIRLVRWLAWVFKNKERKKERMIHRGRRNVTTKIKVGLSPNGLPASRFRDKWQIWDGKRKTCFSPSRIVTFPKCDVFREGCDKKCHKLKKTFLCARASHSWHKCHKCNASHFFVTGKSDKCDLTHPNLRREPRKKLG